VTVGILDPDDRAMGWLAPSADERQRLWPTPQDYNEAIQNPRSSFADPDLRRGAADRNKLGIPQAITGNFATVYRVRTGKEVHAVRCFLRNIPDQQERYELISQHLVSAKLPQAVEFAFIDQGIRVNGAWHPILKMDWVVGMTLAEYVGRHLDDRRALNRLAERFLELLDDLRTRQIAHGDLQHGNLLVVDGHTGPSLRLIDYDGMWVPALDGRESNELGHPNYQHPSRTRQDYGQTLDSFSAWVILSSLVAVRADSSLWRAVRPPRADDRILLGKADYLDPGGSAAVRLFRQARDAAVVHAVERLVGLCPPSDRVLGLPPPTEEDLGGGRTSWLPGAVAPVVHRSWWKTEPAPQTTVRNDAGPATGGSHLRAGAVPPAEPAPIPAVAPPIPAVAPPISTPSAATPSPASMKAARGWRPLPSAPATPPTSSTATRATATPTPAPASVVYADDFRATGNLVAPRSGHTATLLPNGRILIVGGFDRVTLASAELYESRGFFTPTGNLTARRTGHTATLLPNGRVLIAGGSNGKISLASAELYDPESGTFTPTGAMTPARQGHTATLLPKGRVLIAGGLLGGASLASAELYDPESGTFTPTSDLTTTRWYHTATLLPNGRVLISGGQASASAELYDPDSGTFTPTGNLTTTRWYHTATLLPNGRVLIAGGSNGKISLASADLYSSEHGSFTRTDSMASARTSPAATLLPDGRVLIAGGYNTSGDLAAAELYDPAHEAFIPLAYRTAARTSPTATLLPNGRVLLAGGLSGRGALDSAELFW